MSPGIGWNVPRVCSSQPPKKGLQEREEVEQEVMDNNTYSGDGFEGFMLAQ